MKKEKIKPKSERGNSKEVGDLVSFRKIEAKSKTSIPSENLMFEKIKEEVVKWYGKANENANNNEDIYNNLLKLIDLAIQKTAEKIIEKIEKDEGFQIVDDIIYFASTIEDWEELKKKWCNWRC